MKDDTGVERRERVSEPGRDGPEEEEDDFMSDAILAQVVAASESNTGNKPRSYTEKRRKRLHDQDRRAKDALSPSTPASRAERERVARNEALSRNLIDQALQAHRATSSSSSDPQERESARLADRVEEEGAERGKPRAKVTHVRPSPSSGPSAALKLMMSMGYEHGRALGPQASSRPSGAASASDGKAAPAEPTSAKTTGFDQNEPLKADDRWLEAGGAGRKGGGRGAARFGLGSVTLAELVRSKAASDRAKRRVQGDGNDDDDGDDGTHAKAMDDFRARQAEAGKNRHAENLLHDARRTCEDLDRKTHSLKYSVLWLDPQLLKPDARPTEADMEFLDYAFGADADVVSTNLEDEQGTHTNEAAERRREAQEFCKLDAARRLALTTHHLRTAYNYCLFCGVRFDSPEELASQCPGEDEDDH